MRAGKMRHRVSLKRLSSSQDEFGGEVGSFAHVATVWAQVSPLTGREFLESGAEQNEQMVRFRMRHRKGVNDTWRVEWLGESYEIVSAVNNAGLRRETVILAKLAKSNGV